MSTSKIVEQTGLYAVDGAQLYIRIFQPLHAKRGKAVLSLYGFLGFEKNLDLLLELAHSGYVVATFDYSGIWRSEGKYSPFSGVRDSVSVVNKVNEIIGDNSLKWSVFGHSWGGTQALLLAKETAIFESVIAMAPVFDLRDMVGQNREQVENFFRSSVEKKSWSISKDLFNSDVDRIHAGIFQKGDLTGIKSRVSLLHGELDDVVPIAHSNNIRKFSEDRFKLVPLKEMGHIPFDRPKVLEEIINCIS